MTLKRVVVLAAMTATMAAGNARADYNSDQQRARQDQFNRNNGSSSYVVPAAPPRPTYAPPPTYRAPEPGSGSSSYSSYGSQGSPSSPGSRPGEGPITPRVGGRRDFVTDAANGNDDAVQERLGAASEDEISRGLLAAVEGGHATTTRIILERITPSSGGRPSPTLVMALLKAARLPTADVVVALLDFGADPNQTGTRVGKETCEHRLLHEAASAGRADLIKAFASHGADIDAVDSCGKSPESRARAAGSARALSAIMTAYSDLGMDYEQGTRSKVVDGPRALALHERACAGGLGEGCARAGTMLSRGKLVPRDDTRAIDFLSKEGAGGGLYWMVLTDTLERRATADDLARARAVYERECPGTGSACLHIGKMYAQGISVPKDAQVAAGYYEKGCNGPAGGGSCAAAADAYLKGEGRPKDLDAADKFDAMACKYRAWDSCTRLAERLAAAHKIAEAKRVADPACERSAPACRVMGAIFLKGDGASPNRAAALGWYKRACDLQDARGCSEAAAIYAKGDVQVAADAVAQTALLGRACDLRDAASCRSIHRPVPALAAPIPPATASPAAPAKTSAALTARTPAP